MMTGIRYSMVEVIFDRRGELSVFSKLSDLKKASLFIMIVFILVATIIVLPLEESTSLFMFVPLISVFLTLLITGEAFKKAGWAQLGFRRFSIKMLAIAFFIPIIPILLGYILVWTTGLGTLELADQYKGQELLLILNFFTSSAFASLTVTLGEEVGWRGFLSSKLQSLGMVKACLLNGFVWGLFHLPVLIFTDVYHDGVNLLAYIPLFMATITLAGAFMTYVRYASGSIWPAIIAHSIHNTAWNYGIMFTKEPDPIVTFITGDAGFILIVFYLIVFGFIAKQHKRNSRALA